MKWEGVWKRFLAHLSVINMEKEQHSSASPPTCRMLPCFLGREEKKNLQLREIQNTDKCDYARMDLLACNNVDGETYIHRLFIVRLFWFHMQIWNLVQCVWIFPQNEVFSSSDTEKEMMIDYTLIQMSTRGVLRSHSAAKLTHLVLLPVLKVVNRTS